MKVFLSHAHSDAALAQQISNALAENGLEVWDSEQDLFPGDNWAGEVARALEESEAMVVLLTPEAMNSPHVRHEISYALGAKNYSNRLFPVVVGLAEDFPVRSVPWIVRELPWVELEDTDVDATKVTPIADAILSHA